MGERLGSALSGGFMMYSGQAESGFAFWRDFLDGFSYMFLGFCLAGDGLLDGFSSGFP